VRLEGWNRIPQGYGATFDVAAAPWWLRAWFRTPFVDRFAYPVMVERGYGWLCAHPGTTEAEREPVTGGWRVRPPDYRAPGSTAPLT